MLEMLVAFAAAVAAVVVLSRVAPQVPLASVVWALAALTAVLVVAAHGDIAGLVSILDGRGRQ